jgi:hypothetical protein
VKLVFYRIAKEQNVLRGKVVWASKNHSQKASSKPNFQPVRSLVLHYELLLYRIAKERNFALRNGSVALREPFPASFIQDPFPACNKFAPASSKLVFYRIEKKRNLARRKVSFCLHEPFSNYTNFTEQRAPIYGSGRTNEIPHDQDPSILGRC